MCCVVVELREVGYLKCKIFWEMEQNEKISYIENALIDDFGLLFYLEYIDWSHICILRDMITVLFGCTINFKLCMVYWLYENTTFCDDKFVGTELSNGLKQFHFLVLTCVEKVILFSPDNKSTPLQRIIKLLISINEIHIIWLI